jgi:hypothetical protein
MFAHKYEPFVRGVICEYAPPICYLYLERLDLARCGVQATEDRTVHLLDDQGAIRAHHAGDILRHLDVPAHTKVWDTKVSRWTKGDEGYPESIFLRM